MASPASTFIALRPRKCTSLPLICVGQPSVLGQNHLASPSGFTSGVPQSGHTVGKAGRFAPGCRLDSSTPVILGMISPPFSTYTQSPSWMSSIVIWSSFTRVARLTIVPDRNTGSMFATGVTAPVRPTW